MQWRLTALFVVTVLLCVPAITRVTQRLEHGASVSLTSGYSKSADCPPKRISVPPIAPVAAAPVVVAAAAKLVIPRRTETESLPELAVLDRVESLRAPPAHAVS